MEKRGDVSLNLTKCWLCSKPARFYSSAEMTPACEEHAGTNLTKTAGIQEIPNGIAQERS